MKIIWEESIEIAKVRSFRKKLLKKSVKLTLDVELHCYNLSDGDDANDIILYFELTPEYVDGEYASMFNYFSVIDYKYGDRLQRKFYPDIKNNDTIDKNKIASAIRWAASETDKLVEELKKDVKSWDHYPYYSKGTNDTSLQEIFDNIRLVLNTTKDYDEIYKQIRTIANELDLEWE